MAIHHQITKVYNRDNYCISSKSHCSNISRAVSKALSASERVCSGVDVPGLQPNVNKTYLCTHGETDIIIKSLVQN